MRSTRSIICDRLMSSAHTMTEIYNIKHVLSSSSLLLLKALDLDALEFIFKNLKFLFTIE
jgi:hypothetical protein